MYRVMTFHHAQCVKSFLSLQTKNTNVSLFIPKFISFIDHPCDLLCPTFYFIMFSCSHVSLLQSINFPFLISFLFSTIDQLYNLFNVLLHHLFFVFYSYQQNLSFHNFSFTLYYLSVRLCMYIQASVVLPLSSSKFKLSLTKGKSLFKSKPNYSLKILFNVSK